LNISDPTGENWMNLGEVEYKNISIAPIPRTGMVSFWNSPDAFTQTLFQSVLISGGTSKIISKDFYGADYLWDYSSEHILISHTENKGGNEPILGVMNSNGGEYKNLGAPTFVSKCAWSRNGKDVYYALPGEIPDGMVLPNDYNARKFYTADTFWKMNTETAEKEKLLETDKIKEKYDVQEMFLNEKEDFLFFLNRIDGKLYRLSL
jgi:hypothetical protein